MDHPVCALIRCALASGPAFSTLESCNREFQHECKRSARTALRTVSWSPWRPFPLPTLAFNPFIFLLLNILFLRHSFSFFLLFISIPFPRASPNLHYFTLFLTLLCLADRATLFRLFNHPSLQVSSVFRVFILTNSFIFFLHIFCLQKNSSPVNSITLVSSSFEFVFVYSPPLTVCATIIPFAVTFTHFPASYLHLIHNSQPLSYSYVYPYTLLPRSTLAFPSSFLPRRFEAPSPLSQG